MNPSDEDTALGAADHEGVGESPTELAPTEPDYRDQARWLFASAVVFGPALTVIEFGLTGTADPASTFGRPAVWANAGFTALLYLLAGYYWVRGCADEGPPSPRREVEPPQAVGKIRNHDQAGLAEKPVT